MAITRCIFHTFLFSWFPVGEIFGQGQNLRPKFLTREIDNEIPFHSTKQEKEKRKYINSPNLNAEYLKIVSLKYPPQKKKKKKEKESAAWSLDRYRVLREKDNRIGSLEGLLNRLPDRASPSWTGPEA